MSQPVSSSVPPSDPHNGPHITPRADFIASLAWIGLGSAITIGSVMMDRLEDQDINPNTIPGLLPGLLGIAMILLGLMLGVRSLRRGALKRPVTVGSAPKAGPNLHFLLVLALCLAFGVGLVGHGLPFWLAAGLFVTVAILALQHAQRKAVGQRLTARAILTAAIIGFAAGGAVTLVFQGIFLVRLP